MYLSEGSLYFFDVSGLVCCFFSFVLSLVFGCYLYTSCVLCVPFPSTFNIFALFTYQEKKKEKGWKKCKLSWKRNLKYPSIFIIIFSNPPPPFPIKSLCQSKSF